MRQEMMAFWDAVASAGPHANNLHVTYVIIIIIIISITPATR